MNESAVIHNIGALYTCDHLDGKLFLDRVTDPTTFTTWEQFERFHRDAFVERITEFVRRVGS